MNTRIRYSATQTKNVLKSKNVYHHPTNGGRYRINLNLDLGQWTIVDDDSNLPVLEGCAARHAQLKLKARQALATLGVTLEVEARERLVKTNLV